MSDYERNADVSKTLTEKWKKGELLEDFYYVRCAWSDEVETRYVHNGVDDWQEIIAEVPSFEQWQEFKELLKECREHFITYKRDDLDKGYVVYDGSYLIAKIDQVLADNKIQANTVACNKIQENEE